MTKEALTNILKQLYQAQSQGLIKDYHTSFQELRCAHQNHLAHIQKRPVPFTIHIKFYPTTPQSKKIALKDYFTSTYQAQATLTKNDSTLRVDIYRQTQPIIDQDIG